VLLLVPRFASWKSSTADERQLVRWNTPEGIFRSTVWIPRRVSVGDSKEDLVIPVDTPEIDIDKLARAVRQGATIIDVREPVEYDAGHVPGAVLMPMGQLPGRTAELGHSAPVYVVCASGNRSAAMSAFLRGAGFDAYSVPGGTSAWARSGRPIVGRSGRA
jgi:rhodanese-related sulfurtransferase